MKCLVWIRNFEVSVSKGFAAQIVEVVLTSLGDCATEQVVYAASLKMAFG